METGANVRSIDAVREFRTALATFVVEAHEAMVSYELELRRAMDWMLKEEPARWKQELRRAEDKVTEAKIELERCRYTRLPGGEPASCVEERKILERARAQRQRIEDGLEALRKIAVDAEREYTACNARTKQMTEVLDGFVPQSMSLLDRVLASLESYTAGNHEAVAAVVSGSIAAEIVGADSQSQEQTETSDAKED